MDIDEVRALTDGELEAELAAARRNLYDLRFQLATRQLSDYNQIGARESGSQGSCTVQTERRHRDDGRGGRAMSGVKVERQRKTKVGRVVSDKMDKTIVVSVERLSRHPLYKRVIRLTTKFKAHDERNEARIGDTVRIEESRPLSASKRWRLVEIVQRADRRHERAELVAEEASTERGDPRCGPSGPARRVARRGGATA